MGKLFIIGAICVMILACLVIIWASDYPSSEVVYGERVAAIPYEERIGAFLILAAIAGVVGVAITNRDSKT